MPIIPTTITTAAIRACLPEAFRDAFSLIVEDTLPSTNTILKQMALSGAPAGTVLIARRQTAGRGRLGRIFHSPDGNLYMSILIHTDIHAGDALFLTTSTAVACAEAIDAVRAPAEETAKIKWVNDIYIKDKKVCGILAETGLSADSPRLSYAVIGIGVNLLPPDGGFPEEIAGIAGALFTENDAPRADRNQLAAEILQRLHPYLQNPADAAYLDAYRSRSLLDGKPIFVRPAGSLGGEEFPATAIGIDDRAGLMVRYEDGTEEVLRSGEADMRASVHLR